MRLQNLTYIYVYIWSDYKKAQDNLTDKAVSANLTLIPMEAIIAWWLDIDCQWTW